MKGDTLPLAWAWMLHADMTAQVNLSGGTEAVPCALCIQGSGASSQRPHHM
jgi:hypothetical protein